MSLNDTKIRNLKLPVTPIKLSDSHGLYLHVRPTDSRLWYFRYYFSGKETRIALGAYPLISLSEARQKRVYSIAGVRYSGRGAKMRTPHIVPLSRQAIDILKQIQTISGHLELIFPGDHNPCKPMCENTVNKALRLMGYNTKTDVCGHGFRAMACSALMESELW